MASEDEIQGIGGWLQFLIIALIFLGPIVLLAAVYNQSETAESTNAALVGNPIWENIKATSWIMALLGCGVSIFAGVTLYKSRQRSAVKIAIACLWISGPIFTTLGIWIIGIIASADAFSTPEASTAISRSIVPALVWTVYLLRSRRVKLTYTG